MTRCLRAARAAAVLLATLAAVPAAKAQDFSYNPPGSLTAGSGEGREDDTVYVPGMRFPIEQAPAYANSQVWGHGGMSGPGGGECDDENFQYPWWDNYCESRSWDMPLCPSGQGHQGQDIRAASCQDSTHWAVAGADGTISSIGVYTVSLTTEDGTILRYLHLNMGALAVESGDTVQRGDRIGLVSNDFGDSSTTVHLHFDIFMDVDGFGGVYVPTYMTLVEGYEELLGTPGVTCEPLGSGDLTILDNKSPCFRLHGPATTWRYVTDAGYDDDLYWSYTWENDASNWAEWRLEFDESGDYELEVYITPAYAQSQETRYTVTYGDQTDELQVDQSQGDGWLSLGTFAFEAGVPQSVAVYDGPGEALELQRQFQADALRITPVGVEPGDDPPADEGTPDLGVGDEPVADAGADSGGPDAGSEDTGSDGGGDGGGEDEESGGQPGETAVTVNDGCGCSSMPTPIEPASILVAALLALFPRRRRTRSQ